MTSSTVSRWWKAAVPVAALAGFVAGSADRPGPQAIAEVRRKEPREAFQSGSERSETVLREISDTLTRLDGRVARIEQALIQNPADAQPNP
jgi:hypothetical protein